MPERPLAAVEADLFGAIFGFHTRIVSLLRGSSLDGDKLKVVADRIKTLLDAVTAELNGTQPLSVTQRLEAAYDEAKRLVDELSHSDGGDNDKKAKPRTRRLKGQKKP
jgi:hypothetical protein